MPACPAASAAGSAFDFQGAVHHGGEGDEEDQAAEDQGVGREREHYVAASVETGQGATDYNAHFL